MTLPAGTLGLLLSLVAAPPVPHVSADTAPLEFHGFRAGARLDELQALVRSLDGGKLRCDRAKADRRVTECRGVLADAELGGPVTLWVAASDCVASVNTLPADVGAGQLDRWRQSIEQRYGRVDATVQGTQWMMQWVRQRRMLRLTWRIEGGEKTASVSLVDGRVLDEWHGGRPR